MKKLSSNLLAAGLLTAGSLLAINAQAMSTQPESSGYTQTKTSDDAGAGHLGL